MGQKVNPIAFRLGVVADWKSIWFSNNDYSKWLLEDFNIRNYIKKVFVRAGVSMVTIMRKADFTEIRVKIARPGVVFGRDAMDVSMIKSELELRLGHPVVITVLEESIPDLSARLLALWITGQLERRIPFRRAMKMSVQRAIKAGAFGVKIACSGRLGGIEIARREWCREGRIPLHTIRADIDYAFTEALTTYGKIGVKVWIYKGDVDNFVSQNFKNDKEVDMKSKKTSHHERDKRYVNAKKD